MSYFIVFLITLIFAADLSYFFKRGFGATVAIGNFILIFILYVCGLFGNLRIGMYIYFATVAALTASVCFKSVKDKDFSRVSNIFKNPLFIFYAITGMALGVMFINKISVDYDEMSHWALVAKNMFTYDNFGNLGDTTTMFNRYVPGTGIFMYAFQFFNKNFVNGNLYPAFDMLLISLLIPFCEKYNKKLSFGFFISLIFLLGIPVITKTNIYYNLLVDGILAVLTAYIYIAYIIDRENPSAFTFIEIGFASFTLTLVKSSGIALASIAFCFIIADILIRGRKEIKSFLKRPINILLLAFPIIMMVAAKVSWNIYVEQNGVRAGWDSSEMTFSAIIEFFKNPNEFQRQVLNKFVRTFFVGKFYYNYKVYLQVPAVALFAFYALAAIVVGIKSKKAAFPILQFGVSALALIGYGFFMLLLYVFSFIYRESLNLASYPRYMGSYISATLLIWYVLVADEFMTQKSKVASVETKKRERKELWAIPATALAVFATIGVCFGNAFFTWDSKKFTDPYKEWIECVEQLDDTDRVYYLMKDFAYKGHNVREYIRVRFYATPTRCSGFQEGGSMKEGRNAQAAYTGNPFMADSTDVNDLAEQLLQYDYLFIDAVDDDFIAEFGTLFADDIEPKILYKIDKTDGIKLYKAEL